MKADWEERQKRKAEKAKEEGDKGKGDEKDAEKSKDNTNTDKTKTLPKATSPAPTPAPQQPSHEKYALHRGVFALRTAEHRKRKQVSQANALAPRLPGAPRNAVN